jgi:hypothetical protein
VPEVAIGSPDAVTKVSAQKVESNRVGDGLSASASGAKAKGKIAGKAGQAPAVEKDSSSTATVASKTNVSEVKKKSVEFKAQNYTDEKDIGHQGFTGGGLSPPSSSEVSSESGERSSASTVSAPVVPDADAKEPSDGKCEALAISSTGETKSVSWANIIENFKISNSKDIRVIYTDPQTGAKKKLENFCRYVGNPEGCTNKSCKRENDDLTLIYQDIPIAVSRRDVNGNAKFYLCKRQNNYFRRSLYHSTDPNHDAYEPIVKWKKDMQSQGMDWKTLLIEHAIIDYIEEVYFSYPNINRRGEELKQHVIDTFLKNPRILELFDDADEFDKEISKII